MTNLFLSAVLDKTVPVKTTDALLLALLGIALVFLVLALLMLVVWVTGKIFEKSKSLQKNHPELAEKLASAKAKITPKSKAAKAEPAPAVAVAEEKIEEPLAAGTCGELVLVNTDERDAAMIMAIVADETGTPLNELRFKSIKRIDQENE